MKQNFAQILVISIIMIIFLIGCSSKDVSAPSSAGKSGITREVELEVCAGMPQVGEAPLDAYCYIGLAAKYKDTSICQKMSSDVRRGCYGIIAQASNNAAVCEEAGAYKDNCYAEYARNAKDASACEKVADVNQKDSCYMDAANRLADASFCEKMKIVPNKDNCYQNMAMRLQDKAFCDKITAQNIKDSCTEEIGRVYGR